MRRREESRDLEKSLHSLAEERVSDSMDLWPRIRERLDERGTNQERIRTGIQPHPRTFSRPVLGVLKILSPVALSVLILGGLLYLAAGPWHGVTGSEGPGHTPTVANGGRSSTEPVRKVLAGDRIGRAAFGESPETVVRRLEALLGRPPSKPYHANHAGGGVDHEIRWPGLTVYFGRGRFVGYEYGWRKQAGNEPVLATRKGLRVGDKVAVGERLYGRAFQLSAEQGGAWFVKTPHGRLMGYTSDVTNPKGKILTIDAGHVGGPALSP